MLAIPNMAKAFEVYCDAPYQVLICVFDVGKETDLCISTIEGA